MSNKYIHSDQHGLYTISSLMFEGNYAKEYLFRFDEIDIHSLVGNVDRLINDEE